MIALLLVCQSQRLLPARFLAQFLGISDLAALLMRDKIWRRLGEIADRGLLGGPGVPVEIDETLISRYVRRRASEGRLSAFGLTDRRRFRVFLVNDRRRATLLPIIRRHVAPGSIVNTDGFASYATLGSEGFAHKVCNHSKGFFVGFDGATTTAIDSYWGELKRSIGGIHQGISEARLGAFLDAHSCRYSFRNAPAKLFWQLLGGEPRPTMTAAGRPAEAVVFASSAPPRCAAGSYGQLHSLFADECEATKLLGSLVLARTPVCPACLADGRRYADVRGQRIVCSACGDRPSVRRGTLFSHTKIPLRTWFALLWLMTLSHRGISIGFASSHLGVSKAAAGTMLTRVREAMASAIQSRRIGGAGQTVDLALFRMRVRPTSGNPRRRHRTVIVASDATGWTCDVLPRRSARYVQLWTRKKIRPGSAVRHPPGRAFAEVAEADVRSEPVSAEGAKSLACRGHIVGAKAALKTFHTGIDFHKAELFLKEREYKSLTKSADFAQTLACLAFALPPADRKRLPRAQGSVRADPQTAPAMPR